MIKHKTQYDYSLPVGLCHSEAHLQPISFATQQCLSSQLEIRPEPVDYHERIDYFGNRVVYFAVQQAHSQLIVTASSEVEVLTKEGQVNISECGWEDSFAQLQAVKAMPESKCAELQLVKLLSLDSAMAASSHDIKGYASESFKTGRSVFDVAEDLTQRIYRDFNYDPSFTTIATPLAMVLLHKRGVCQDFAHLAIACFRSFGLPARYVSGYIETMPPEGVVKLAGSDASHAWFSVYQPGYGWMDFDPTNNCITGEQHITLAWGRDYNDVTPLKGVAVGGSDHQVSVAVDVTRCK